MKVFADPPSTAGAACSIALSPIRAVRNTTMDDKSGLTQMPLDLLDDVRFRNHSNRRIDVLAVLETARFHRLATEVPTLAHRSK